MDVYEFITFEEGWKILQNGITKLESIVEGLPVPNFTCAEHIHLYTTVYYMCKNKVSDHYDQGLYDKYRKTCQEYISSKVYEELNKEIMDAIHAALDHMKLRFHGGAAIQIVGEIFLRSPGRVLRNLFDKKA
ncbi:hypothetical protein TSUD_202550 [Trifolium subterraneum]|uniref:Cullin N-terminal domain-containing protein n=1 Tax=Trifolium subterraneum TaxID=3900 RepID=A0A2Z6LPK9_TRISU|nr:hypothetical protein TSUD_202550 [Trifolium subterraneum]